MRFSVDRDAFHEALQAVLYALPRTTTTEIRNNVYLSLKDSQLLMYGANLDFHVEWTLQVEGEEDGAVTLPGKTLDNIVGSADATTLKIESQGYNVRILTGSGRYNLLGLDPEQYLPRRELKEPQLVLRAPLGILQKANDTVTFSAAKDDPRPYLNGILVQVRDGELRFVASDSHRLALYRVMSADFAGQADAIVPREAFEFVKKLKDGDTQVRLLFGEGSWGLEANGVRMVTRLIEGPYANYEDVIPRPDGNTLQVSRPALEQALRRLMIVADPPTYLVKMSLSEGKVELTATSSSVGEGTETLEARYIGEPLELGINAQSFQEILRHIDDDEVIVRVYSPTSALRIDPAHPLEDESLLYLTMPLRLE